MSRIKLYSLYVKKIVNLHGVLRGFSVFKISIMFLWLYVSTRYNDVEFFFVTYGVFVSQLTAV